MRAILFAAVLAVAGQIHGAAAQEREWNLDTTDQDALLVFGTPGTDDVGVSLSCQVGGKRVRFYIADAFHPGSAPSNGLLRLYVNKTRFTLPATTTRQDSAAAYVIETEISLSGKVLDELSRADYFVAIIGRHRASYPFEGEYVDQLRKACAPKPAGT